MSSIKKAWRQDKHSNSLPEVFSSVTIPKNAGFWRKFFAFAGPGLMIAVGYMDPGNWATDIDLQFICDGAATFVSEAGNCG